MKSKKYPVSIKSKDVVIPAAKSKGEGSMHGKPIMAVASSGPGKKEK